MTEPIDPPVPEDLDLRKLDSFMLNRTRLLASRLWAMSTGEEFKAWFSLIMMSWHEVPAGSLPNDDRILAGFSCAGTRWPKVKAVALHGWKLGKDGRLYHPVHCEDALRAGEQQERYEQKKRDTAARVEKHRKGKKPLPDGKETPSVTGDVTRYETPKNDDVTRDVLARIDKDKDKYSSASAEQDARAAEGGFLGGVIQSAGDDQDMLRVALEAADVMESPGDVMLAIGWREAGATADFVRLAIRAKRDRREAKGEPRVESLRWYDGVVRDAMRKPTPAQKMALVENPVDPTDRRKQEDERLAEIAALWAAGNVQRAAEKQAMYELVRPGLYDQSRINDRKHQLRQHFHDTGQPLPIHVPEVA